MADEVTTTSANDIYFAAWVEPMILEEARPYNVMRPFFHTVSGSKNSSAVDFPIQDDPGAAGASYTEGTGLSNTALTTTKATATAVSTGMMATVTDELVENSLIDTYPHFGGVLARSVAERFETDATALLDDFSNTTNTAGVPFTYATALEAVNQLEQRDQLGVPVGVIDPAQTLQVRQDIGTSGAAIWGSDALSEAVRSTQGVALEAAIGRFAGADWFQTSLVTATGGGVFLKDTALALYEIRPIRSETERDASMPGTEIVLTTRYGMVERRDAAGETILA